MTLGADFLAGKKKESTRKTKLCEGNLKSNPNLSRNAYFHRSLLVYIDTKANLEFLAEIKHYILIKFRG